jgi:hypothetical protein
MVQETVVELPAPAQCRCSVDDEGAMERRRW